MRDPLTSHGPLVARPLEAAAYEPYGGVIEASASAPPANQGTALRRDRVVAVANERASASLNVAVFRCAARAMPTTIALLEKHPHTTQAFVPMNASRYLVVVALGGDAPDLGTLAAFVASGRQGVSYRPGVWHHPMIALDAETDFVCLVHEDGSRDDCVEHALGSPIAVVLGGAP